MEGADPHVLDTVFGATEPAAISGKLNPSRCLSTITSRYNAGSVSSAPASRDDTSRLAACWVGDVLGATRPHTIDRDEFSSSRPDAPLAAQVTPLRAEVIAHLAQKHRAQDLPQPAEKLGFRAPAERACGPACLERNLLQQIFKIHLGSQPPAEAAPKLLCQRHTAKGGVGGTGGTGTYNGIGGDAYGGGVFVYSTANISLTDGTDFEANQALGGAANAAGEGIMVAGDGGNAFGGGLADLGATLNMNTGTVERNEAIGAAGASGALGSDGGAGGAAQGAGIFTTAKTTLTGVAFTSNMALGGAGGTGGDGGPGGQANAGGLFALGYNFKVTVTNGSFTRDEAVGGAGAQEVSAATAARAAVPMAEASMTSNTQPRVKLRS